MTMAKEITSVTSQHSRICIIPGIQQQLVYDLMTRVCPFQVLNLTLSSPSSQMADITIYRIQGTKKCDFDPRIDTISLLPSQNHQNGLGSQAIKRIKTCQVLMPVSSPLWFSALSSAHILDQITRLLHLNTAPRPSPGARARTGRRLPPELAPNVRRGLFDGENTLIALCSPHQVGSQVCRRLLGSRESTRYSRGQIPVR